METLAGIRSHQHPLPTISLQLRPSFPKPSVTLKPLFNPTLRKPLKISSSSSSSSPQPQRFESLKSRLSSLLKSTCVALAATALFLGRFNNPSSIAAPIFQPSSTVDSTDPTTDSDEVKEKTLEEYLDSHPEDARGLKALMEVKIKLRKFPEAIGIVDKLIKTEPFEPEWALFKSHLQNYNGDLDSARLGFEEVISKNPLSVEAYHGLIMVVSQSGSGELDGVIERIESAMEKCKKERKKDVLRDFKLLLAQVRVIEGKYTDALKVYQELVKEEPRDFRPYLCQGIIYTLLRKKDEADKHFQKYKRLVPKEHPYARYFDDNMIATKLFAQKVDSERMGSR